MNRSPAFVVQNLTLETAWSGRNPSVKHFKIFMCIAYAHVLKRKKLDDTGQKRVFLGVREIYEAYKLFDLFIGKIVTSRDVCDKESM